MLKTAITYPAMLCLASGLMMVLVLYFVFPMLVNVTTQAGAELPALTLFLIKVASTKVLFSVLTLAFLSALAFKLAMRRDDWRYNFLSFWEEYVPLGRFWAKTQALSGTRQLALLSECGVDLVRSLRLAGETASESYVAGKSFAGLALRTKEGEKLSESFALYPVFPKLLTCMVAAAEETGGIHEALYRTCDILEEEMAERLSNLGKALEPILLGVMGIVIGVILLGAFLPVYNLVRL